MTTPTTFYDRYLAMDLLGAKPSLTPFGCARRTRRESLVGLRAVSFDPRDLRVGQRHQPAMRWGPLLDELEPSTPETPLSAVFQAPETADSLFLLAAQNDFETLGIFHSAVRHDRSIGVVAEDMLRTLDCQMVNHASGRLHILNATRVPAGRLVCFTSGSTGHAKGILRTVESWHRTFQVQRQLYPYPRAANAIIIGSLAHSMHLYGAMEAIDRGLRPLVMPKFAPRQLADLCGQRKNLLIYATPSHLNLMLSFAAKQWPGPLDAVSHIFCGGAKLDEQRLGALHDLFPAAQMVEFFGTTETSYVTVKSPDAPRGSVGRACPGVDIRIKDAHGNEVPAGQVGTLWVNSPMLFERYIVGEDPHTQWQDGFVTVGDQGFLDREGYFYFSHREGLMVTIAGENVYLGQVEYRLRQLVPDGEIAVVARPDRARGRCLVAVVQVSLSAEERDAVLRSLRGQLGSLVAPKAIIQAAEWPYLPSGKIDREAISRLVEQGP